MRVRVQLYAQLRDTARTDHATLELREGGTVAELLEALYTQLPALRSWDKNILVGAGVEFVERDHVVLPNDEIAIMPPVQGG